MSNQDVYRHTHALAVVAMSLRFPGAKTVAQYWHNLKEGIESISHFSAEELAASPISPKIIADPNYVSAAGVVEDIDLFDAGFFNMSPKEAEVLDPQHRLFLECAWEALEQAGGVSNTPGVRIGVYAGKPLSLYLLNNLYATSDADEPLLNLQVTLGNEKDYLATQTSYRLNLNGPSMSIQTACSTSLVAVHMACQSLLSHESDIALAGGVTIRVPRVMGYLYEKGGVVSADGHCRAFDAKAQGSVPGNGVGVVVLKRLSDALEAGDNIQAIVRGSAINNDGAAKAGYTAPSEDGQTEVILEALAMADVDPESISYVETHGTGTALGDPIEIAALTRAYRHYTEDNGFCAIGSVKTNIGHLEAAAGVAGLIKTILALKHKQIPPSLHFEQPNPHIDFENSPFYVNNRLMEWPSNGQPRRAGVSSFGMGGTNAHVILEEAPARKEAPSTRPCHLLVLSAKTATAVDHMTASLAHHLRTQPFEELADVAFTLQTGRREFDYRRVLVCQTGAEAVAAWESLDPKQVLDGCVTPKERSVAFMFPGLGDQYVNMAAIVYAQEPVFRHSLDACCALFQPYLDLDLRTLIYPDSSVRTAHPHPAAPVMDMKRMLGREAPDQAVGELKRTSLAQPAVFAMEYALAQLWISWGIKPGAMIGYSLGEYVAACLAGVFSLPDAAFLVAQRARLIETIPAGAMLAVALGEGEVIPWLDESLSLSGVNGAMMCVVAGAPAAIDTLARKLTAENIACRHVQTSHAFHSQMMEPIMQPVAELMASIQLHPPCIPYISNLTGTWITAAQATDPQYWADHLRQPVRFVDGIGAVWQQPGTILLEVGVGQTLGSLAWQHPISQSVAEPIVLSSLPTSYDRQSPYQRLLRSLGQLWLAGVTIDWPQLYAGEKRQHLALPTYPFERQRYWVDRAPGARQNGQARVPGQQNVSRKSDMADWFYIPVWQRIPVLSGSQTSLAEQHWLIFADELGIGHLLQEQLQQAGHKVTAVLPGNTFQRLDASTYTIAPHKKEDYAALLKHLQQLNLPPDRVVHMWSVTAEMENPLAETAVRQALTGGFYSVLYMVQALGDQQMDTGLSIHIVSSYLHDVLGGEMLHPGKAAVLGPLHVVTQEYEHLKACSIDVSPASPADLLARQLFLEVTSPTDDSMVAYRGTSRWVQAYQPISLPASRGETVRLRHQGVYLITGAFGGLGSDLALFLAEQVQARLVLVGRTTLPPRADWPAFLADAANEKKVRRQIQLVQALEALGAEVLTAAADVADREQMQPVMAAASQRFGTIHGVFHLAGVPSAGLMQLKTAEIAETVFRPKILGTLVLDALLRDEPLDFTVLYSSINAIAGGLGEVDYCAANAFLDAFAHYSQQRRIGSTVSINWGLWQWDAWQTSLADSMPKVYEQVKLIRQTYGITFAEGREALTRIWRTSLPQVIAITLDLQAARQHWHTPSLQDYLESVSQTRDTSVYQRPNLRTPYVAPRQETEQKIANIWAKCLAIEKVGVHDHFLELGGNSLLGMVIISHLKKEFHIELSAAALYEGPTVSELHKLIFPEETAVAPLADRNERGQKRKQMRSRRKAHERGP